MGNIRHISQRLSDIGPSTSSSSQRQEQPGHWIDALFGKFAVIWPRDWAGIVERVGDVDLLKREWAEGLAGMTGDQMRAAIAHCRANLKWAPTIAEFREAAKTGDTPEQRAQAARLAAADAERALALPAMTWEERRAAGRSAMADLMSRLAERGSAEVLAAINVQAPATDEPEQRAGPGPDSPEYMALIERRKREALDALAKMEARKTMAAAERDTRGFDAPAETTRG